MLRPARGVAVDDFERLAEIPAFDSDRGEEPIEVIDEFRRRIDAADAVLIAAPEYAGGLSGVVKNALDWLVGSATMYRKPVGVISAGTTGGEHARRMMTQTLTWQGAYVVAELGISTRRVRSRPTTAGSPTPAPSTPSPGSPRRWSTPRP